MFKKLNKKKKENWMNDEKFPKDFACPWERLLIVFNFDDF